MVTGIIAVGIAETGVVTVAGTIVGSGIIAVVVAVGSRDYPRDQRSVPRGEHRNEPRQEQRVEPRDEPSSGRDTNFREPQGEPHPEPMPERYEESEERLRQRRIGIRREYLLLKILCHRRHRGRRERLEFNLFLCKSSSDTPCCAMRASETAFTSEAAQLQLVIDAGNQPASFAFVEFLKRTWVVDQAPY